jgi:hypothetical protein
MLLVVVGLLLFVLLASRREGFKFEMKTDFGGVGLGGMPNLATAATAHLKYLHDTAWEYIPFRSKLRAMHREFRRRKFYKD